MNDVPTELDIRSSEDTHPNPVSWRVDSGAVATNFREGGEYRIRTTGEGDCLSIDDEKLKTDGDDWVWSPRILRGTSLRRVVWFQRKSTGDIRV